MKACLYTIVLCILLNRSVDAQNTYIPTFDDLVTMKAPDYLELSPIGGELVYAAAGQLWLVSICTSGEPKRLVKGSLPTWSPDGKRLAYYSQDSGTQQLWVLDFSTLRTDRITSLPGGIRPDPTTRMSGWIKDPLRFSWSPDSERLVFASQVELSTGSSKSVLAVQPGDPKLGTPLVLTPTTPAAWTLSGIFTSAFGPSTPKAVSDKPAALPPPMVNQLFVVDVPTKTLQQLTRDDAVYFNPEWSPNGGTIVCA